MFVAARFVAAATRILEVCQVVDFAFDSTLAFRRFRRLFLITFGRSDTGNRLYPQEFGPLSKMLAPMTEPNYCRIPFPFVPLGVHFSMR